MGWNPFASKRVTRVATSVSRVIADDALPGAVKTGSVKAFFKEGNIADYVMEELVASLGVRAENMYRYGDAHYTHGLPSGEVYSSTQGRAQVEAVIEQAEGQQVLMEYSHFGAPNTLHIGWMKLIGQHGYNPATNQLGTLTGLKGVPVYLKDMVVVVPTSQLTTLNGQVLEQWGTAACAGYTPERLSNIGTVVNLVKSSPIVTSSVATELQLLVTYVWKAATPATAPLQVATFTMSLSELDASGAYFHAKYQVAGQTKYWLYKDNSGTYPVLDSVYVDGPAVSGSYFPFAYFRYNKASINADPTTAAYKTTKKLVKYLGIDIDSMADSINENPGIADVEQAMLVLGVPAVSTDPMECRYLFDYFDNLHYAMGGTTLAGSAGVLGLITGDRPKANTIIIKDAQFKMALDNGGIFKRMVAGSIGAVGTHTSAYAAESNPIDYVDAATGDTVSIPQVTKVHRYQHQVAPGLYEEVLIQDLSMTYFIYGDYTTTGDETDDILLIPIDRSLTQAYSIGDREKLYARALHLVFNSRTVTEVKWYQQSWFSTFLIIVAVVLTIMDFGADGGGWIAAATSLTGPALLVAMIIINVIVLPALFAAAFKLFVKAFGQDVATLIALLAVAYGGYKLYQSGGVAGAPWASSMLQLSTGLQQAVLADKYTDLLSQADQFNLFVDEQNKLLETAQDLLDKSHLLNPFVIFGEKPEDFYNRTIHTGNIGTLGINAISSYVDVALTLPKLNDTLGEELNGNS